MPQVEDTASTKVPWYEDAWDFPGTAANPVWLQQSGGTGEVRHEAREHQAQVTWLLKADKGF